MFSSYDIILVCGIHLCLIFFFITCNLQKTKWNFNAQHDVKLVWRKLEENTEKKKSIYLLTCILNVLPNQRQCLSSCHIFANSNPLSLSINLSPGVDTEILKGAGDKKKGGGEINKPYILAYKKEQTYSSYITVSLFVFHFLFMFALSIALVFFFSFSKEELNWGVRGNCEAVAN